MLTLPNVPSSPIQILINAFKLWKIHLKEILLLSLLAIFIGVIPAFFLPKLTLTLGDARELMRITKILYSPFKWHAIFFVLYFVVAGYLFSVIIYRLHMNLFNEEGGVQKAFIRAIQRYPQMLLGSIILTVINAIGFLLLAIPGVYLAIALSMSLLLILIDEKNAFQAIINSFQLTKSHWWHSFITLFISVFTCSLIVIAAWQLSYDKWVFHHTHGAVSILYIILSVIITTLYYPLLCATAIVLKEDLTVRSRIQKGSEH